MYPITTISLLVVLLITTACSHMQPDIRILTPPQEAATFEEYQLDNFEEASELGKRIAQFASTLVGKKQAVLNGKYYRRDCSGTATAIYDSVGISLSGGSESIYEYVKEHGRLFSENPQLGDLIFFDDTYDKNHNGKMDDKLTHVGVVEKIDEDGTLWFVHYMDRKIVRSRMEDMLSKHRTPSKGMTSAQLFVAFGRLD